MDHPSTRPPADFPGHMYEVNFGGGFVFNLFFHSETSMTFTGRVGAGRGIRSADCRLFSNDASSLRQVATIDSVVTPCHERRFLGAEPEHQLR